MNACIKCGHRELLTPRQMDVVLLMCRDMPYKLIAHELGVKLSYVKYMASEIFSRLGCHSSVGAVIWAIRNGHFKVETQ